MEVGVTSSTEGNGVDAALDSLPEFDLSAIMHEAEREKRSRTLNSVSLLLAIAIALAPAAVAYWQAQQQTPEYEAELDVLYQIERASFGETDTIMANAKIMAESQSLASSVAEVFTVDAEELIKSSSVELVEPDTGTRSSVLRFRVRSIEPDVALALADGWVSGFLDQVIVGDPDSTRREELEGIIAELQQRRLDARGAIIAAEGAKATATLETLTVPRRAQITLELDRDISAAGSRYDEIVRDINTQVLLLSQLDPVGPSVDIERLGAAHVDADPVSPQPLRSLALGLATGLILAATYLFMMSHLRSR